MRLKYNARIPLVCGELFFLVTVQEEIDMIHSVRVLFKYKKAKLYQLTAV